MQDEQRFKTFFRIGDGGQDLEIPYRAKHGGIFITIRDAEDQLLGEVQITAANVYWKKPHGRNWQRLTSLEFCDLLDKHAQ
jgi:hypothetical protein